MKKNWKKLGILVFTILLVFFYGYNFISMTEAAISIGENDEFLELADIQISLRPTGGFSLAGKTEDKNILIYVTEEGELIEKEELMGLSSTFSILQGDKLCLVSPIEDENTALSRTQVLNRWKEDGFSKSSNKFLGGVFTENQNSLTIDKQGNYYALSKYDPNHLFIFTNPPMPYQKISSEEKGEYTSIQISPDNFLYATFADGTIGVASLENLSNIQFDFYESDLSKAPYSFLSNQTVLGKNGEMMSLDEDSHTLLYQFDTNLSPDGAICLANGEIILQETENSAVKFSREGLANLRYHFAGELEVLADSTSGAVAIFKTETALQFAKLSNVRQETILPPEEESSHSSEGSNEEEKIQFESDIYTIDKNNQIIYLPPKTTIAVLKNKLSLHTGVLRGEKANGALLTSGYISTGSNLSLLVDGEEKDNLTVIVLGDLTGTGSITNTDENILYRYLDGSTELEDWALWAADMDKDSVIDTADLLLMKKEIHA